MRFFHVPSDPKMFATFIEGANGFYTGRSRPDWRLPLMLDISGGLRQSGWDFAEHMAQLGAAYEARYAAIN